MASSSKCRHNPLTDQLYCFFRVLINAQRNIGQTRFLKTAYLLDFMRKVVDG